MIPFALAFLSLLVAIQLCYESALSHLTFCTLALLATNVQYHGSKMLYTWLLFVLWAFVGAFQTLHPQISLFGSIRYEGVMTLVLGTIFAIAYWRSAKNLWFIEFLCAFGCLLILCGHLFLSEYTFLSFYGPAMPLAAFGAISGVILFAASPWLILIALPVVLMENCRIALPSMAIGIAFYVIAVQEKKLIYLRRLAIIGAIFIAVLPLTPLGHKFSKLVPSTLGTGSRAQWMLQASNMSKQLPLMGVGLDQIHLRETAGSTSPTSGMDPADGDFDRTHNQPLDVLLMTGWIGLMLWLTPYVLAGFMAWEYPSGRNLACVAGLLTYLTFGMVNPQGILPLFINLILLLGMEEQTL